MGLHLSLKHSRAGSASPVTLKFTRAWHTRGGGMGDRGMKGKVGCEGQLRSVGWCVGHDKEVPKQTEPRQRLWSWYQRGGIIHCLEASLYVNTGRRLWDRLNYSTRRQKTVFSVPNHRAVLRLQTGWDCSPESPWVTQPASPQKTMLDCLLKGL